MKFCYFWWFFSLRNEISLHLVKNILPFSRKNSQCNRTQNQVSKSVRGIWMIISLVWAQCIAMFPNLDKCNSQGVTFVLAFVEEWLWSANKTTQLAVITCLPTDTKRHNYSLTYFWRILALYDSGLFLEELKKFQSPPLPWFPLFQTLQSLASLLTQSQHVKSHLEILYLISFSIWSGQCSSLSLTFTKCCCVVIG